MRRQKTVNPWVKALKQNSNSNSHLGESRETLL